MEPNISFAHEHNNLADNLPPMETLETSPLPGIVLIVEDEEDMVSLLDYRLRQEGYDTVIAKNGKLACALAEELRPDCILLDIMLPEMNGWEVCRHIRQNPDEGLAATPIIMLTALSAQREKIKGLELGANVYIPKPYSVKEVLLNTKMLVAGHRARTSLNLEVDRLRSKNEDHADMQGLLCHELRNKLLAISAFTNQLQKNLAGGATDDNKKYLASIQQSVRHMASISDELIFNRQVESDYFKLGKEEIDLNKTVSGVISLSRQMAKSKNIAIAYEPANEANKVRTHAGGLKVILANLIENAIKYSPRGSEINVGLAITDGMELLVTVQDQGEGIEEDEKTKIFEQYYRGEKARRSSHGTGLGLYSVKRLLDSLGGEITVESKPGYGSLFMILLDIN